MDDKVLVRVRLPMADAEYDMRVPMDIPVSRATRMVAELCAKRYGARPPLQASPALWSPQSGAPLPGNRTLRELTVASGDMLLLI